MLDALSVLLRALSFMALFEAAGGALFLTLFRAALPASHPRIHTRVRIAAVSALALVLVQFSLEAPRMAGQFAGLWDQQMQQLAWHSAPGAALRLRVVGLLLVLAGLQIGAPVRSVLWVMGTALVVASFTAIGHTVDHPHHLWLVLLLMAHLASVAFWFGALWPLRQVVTREAPAVAVALLEQFSHLAVWIVPGLLLAGASLVVMLVPGLSIFRHAYGQLLLVKFAGFSLLMMFAGWNKLRLTPALRLHEPTAVIRLRRSLLLEYCIIAAVLAVTALMTGLYSPE